MPARRLIPCHNAIAACLVVSPSLAHALTRIQRRADQQGCRSQRGREQNEQRSDPDQLHALSSCSRRRILLVLQLTYAARRLAQSRRRESPLPAATLGVSEALADARQYLVTREVRLVVGIAVFQRAVERAG